MKRFALLLAILSISVNCYAYDDYTKLLSHFDGADGAQTYTSDDENARTATFVGTAQLDTAIQKFGSASLLLDGNSDYITFPSSADFDFGTGNWTDFWIRFNTVQTCDILSRYQPDVANFSVAYSASKIVFEFRDYGEGSRVTFTVPFTPSVDTQYHIAIIRSGNSSAADWNIYINGGAATKSWLFTDYDINMIAISDTLHIGYGVSYEGYHNGFIDELRIVKGSAEWTSDFTPPTSPYNGVVSRVIIVN
jgi:hypothetical protein